MEVGEFRSYQKWNGTTMKRQGWLYNMGTRETGNYKMKYSCLERETNKNITDTCDILLALLRQLWM